MIRSQHTAGYTLKEQQGINNYMQGKSVTDDVTVSLFFGSRCFVFKSSSCILHHSRLLIKKNMCSVWGQCDKPGCEAREQHILPAGMRSPLDETRC